MKKARNYVLITAARDEEAYIEKTIYSVISQTILPKKWVIVSDNSIDHTEEIVNLYSERYGFIQLLSIKGDVNRNTASKVHAINKGLDMLNEIDYQFIGNIDADIEFESDYFERLLKKFGDNENLGIAGGWIHELQDGKYKERFGNSERNVPGSTQLFRRVCFEMIGGYIPLKTGGEDTTAEVMARMNRWETKCFPDLRVFHHRITGTDKCNTLYARYHQGKEDYFLGYHPMFEALKCLARIKEKPLVIGSIFRFFGYIEGLLSRKPIVIPNEVVKYLRKEQMMRIISLLTMKTSIPS